jgi:hypothetical protein
MLKYGGVVRREKERESVRVEQGKEVMNLDSEF